MNQQQLLLFNLTYYYRQLNKLCDDIHIPISLYIGLITRFKKECFDISECIIEKSFLKSKPVFNRVFKLALKKYSNELVKNKIVSIEDIEILLVLNHKNLKLDKLSGNALVRPENAMFTFRCKKFLFLLLIHMYLHFLYYPKKKYESELLEINYLLQYFVNSQTSENDK